MFPTIYIFILLVKLFTTGHGSKPLLVDKTPPTAGTVLDGPVIRVDNSYQADISSICAQWPGFFDTESGISLYVFFLVSDTMFWIQEHFGVLEPQLSN